MLQIIFCSLKWKKASQFLYQKDRECAELLEFNSIQFNSVIFKHILSYKNISWKIVINKAQGSLTGLLCHFTSDIILAQFTRDSPTVLYRLMFSLAGA